MNSDRRTALTLTLAIVSALPASSASAGPIELFGGIGIPAAKPGSLVTRYIYGGGGFFFSDDAAATMKMSCFGAIDPNLTHSSVQTFKVFQDGSICVSTGRQVLCSDDRGCGWQDAPEVAGQWVSDFTEDPVTPTTQYLATGTAMGMNGLYSRSSADQPFTAFGTHVTGWFNRVHVTTLEDGKRFYVSAQENMYIEDPTTMQMKEVVNYSVRFSDDDAQTWTAHPFTEGEGSMRLVDVDPKDPDTIVVVTRRSAPMAPDDIFVSKARGEPGSYVKIGSVIEFGGSVFGPDGALYYADNDQQSPGFFKASMAGEPGQLLNNEHKIGCLAYDASSDTMFACADFRFGTIDLATGLFTSLFDMKMVSELHECEGEAPTVTRCAAALRAPNFCDITHFPNSPICVETGFSPTMTPSGPAGAAAGAAGAAPPGSTDAPAPGIAGAGGAAGAAPATAGSGAIGDGPTEKPKSSGGGCTSLGEGPATSFGALALACLMLALRRRSALSFRGRDARLGSQRAG